MSESQRRAALPRVLAAYGLGWGGEVGGLPLPGSPERCLWRGLVADAAGHCYLVEELAPATIARKRQIASLVAYLAAQGLPMAPYRRSLQGGEVAACEGGFWQVSPYLDHVPTPQPAWVQDAWRGQAMAEWLLALGAATRRLPPRLAGERFALGRFIAQLARRLQALRPALALTLAPALESLRQGYLAAEPQLPLAFCHGDYHPLNVLWGEGQLLAVIDWEFCGRKPELYDLALLLGCVGAEDPGALGGPFVQALLTALRPRSEASPASWQALPGMVLATRLAWLSEWLRKGDEEMVALETALILLLAEQPLAL